MLSRREKEAKAKEVRAKEKVEKARGRTTKVKAKDMADHKRARQGRRGRRRPDNASIVGAGGTLAEIAIRKTIARIYRLQLRLPLRQNLPPPKIH